LVKDGHLRAKINLVGDSLMLTDGVWVDSDIRVFPFSDESAAISKYCCRRGLLERADLVIDLATGSGHNLAWFGRDVRGVGMDINPRALSYFHLNNVINGLSNRTGVLNDIRRGISNIVDGAGTPNILILGNLPFGLAPTQRTLPFTSNGGETGVDLQGAALAAIAAFMRTKFGARARAVLLGYSVGNSTDGRWQVLDLARAMLPEHELGFSILDDEGLTRVDGRRVLANPSPVRMALQAAGACRLYHQDTDRAQALYACLSDRLVARGFSDLAYVVLEIGPVQQVPESGRQSVDS
jgi:DNA-directed RNA polymerase subunit N (RpoN/RPB10)